MKHYPSLDISDIDDTLLLTFRGDITLYNISKLQKKTDTLPLSKYKKVVLDFKKITFFDTAAAIFIYNLQNKLTLKNIKFELICDNRDIFDMIDLVTTQKSKLIKKQNYKKLIFLEKLGKSFYEKYLIFISFIAFLGELFTNNCQCAASLKSLRYKETIYEINEGGVKALGIIIVTSFLIGLVVAYQSAYQLKLYGANIFIVDMLGLSILRELAPLITAIVIAGRSGSAYTAQIGAMKITQELDAMKTMGFEPYKFLVIPRIIALMIVMPILIFIADIMGVIGGMLIANIDLGISSNLFLDRFSDVIAAKHFFIGLIKGPFFAFLIASISIYRGLGVKNDTQSIGLNTTKSVVESIFAVIMCDALFSIIFTNLGI